MRIEVDEDYSFVLKEVFTGISLESEAGETFAICMRDSGFEFRYNKIWYEAKDGVINPLPSVEKKSLRGYQESLSEKEIEVNGRIAKALTEASEIEEDVIPYISTALSEEEKSEEIAALRDSFGNIIPEEPNDVLGPEGSFGESSEGYGEFDVNRLYEQKDICLWCGTAWRFIGKGWAVNPDTSAGYKTYFHTQKKTIGMYPSEEFGWRKI